MREALRAGAPVETVFVSTDVEHFEPEGAPVVRATPSVLESMSDSVTPQGVVAVVQMRDVELADLGDDADLVVILDQVRDPGNAGTLVRSATAAGAQSVVFTSGAVDPYAPKTVRASAGMLDRVALVRGVPFEDAARSLAARGFAAVGTDASAPTPYDAVDYTRRVAFVVGNEAWGMEPDHRELLTEVVSIPMPGDAESLNAGIAGSILLFEAVRQRRGRLGGTAD